MTMRLRTITLILLSAVLLGSDSADPGVLLELDRERFELTTRDLRDGADGPLLPVALGSPANATPVGDFRLHQVIRNPEWRPGRIARAAGAERVPASSTGPLGVAKIPFAQDGIALHGGAHRLVLGKPVSMGCIRIADPDLLGLLDWLDAQGVLGPSREQPNGERPQGFRRPVRLRVR
jgi:hypothetical protein